MKSFLNVAVALAIGALGGANAMSNEQLVTQVNSWCADAFAATAAYGLIKDWDVSGVTDMSNLFSSLRSGYTCAASFDEDIKSWDTSSVTNMAGMFHGCEIFDGDLSPWNVDMVTDFTEMFKYANSYDHTLCWDTSGDATTDMFFNNTGSTNPSDPKCACANTDTSRYYSDETAQCEDCPDGTESMGFTKSCSIAFGYGDGATCFHADGKVLLEGGVTRTMKELRVGDRVLSADSVGNVSFSKVLFLPHETNTELSVFLTLTTETGKAVDVTPDHLLPKCTGEEVTARALSVGDCLLTVDGKEILHGIAMTNKAGVYTAVTENKYVVVDQIIASPFGVDRDTEREFQKSMRQEARQRERKLLRRGAA